MNAAIVPPEGAPGSTVASPSQPMAETMPTNPSTIAQSTSINTLDQILCCNWIYDSTFTISTTQAPGTIVYYKKIHPRGWNWANTHVSAMFNCWTGSGSVRYRPVATVWYGGSIRVGFLPPSVAEEDISKIPIEVLTTYPNRDIDPKNTGWVEFSPPDERNIAYHYMDDNGRQSFGGWVIFYVAARLVTQSPEFNTINMLAETKGGFMFDQPNPNVLSKVISLSHPLTVSTKFPLSMHSDPVSKIPFDSVQICPTSTIVLHYPGFKHSAFNTAEATLPAAGPIRAITPTNIQIDTTDPTQTMSFDEDGMVTAFGTFAENDSKITEVGYALIEVGGRNISFSNSASELPDGRKGEFKHTRTQIGLKKGNLVTTKIDGIRKVTNLTIPTLTRERANESIVVFCNLAQVQYSSQSQLIAQDVKQFTEATPNSRITYLYVLTSDSGTPIMQIRLWPNGMFTTNGSTGYLVTPITTDMSLRFVGTLPADDAMPPAPATFLSLKPMFSALANNRALKDEVINELKCF